MTFSKFFANNGILCVRFQVTPQQCGFKIDTKQADYEYLTKGGVFPQRLIDIWIARKRAELRKLEQIPNPAEFKLYYDL